jgi:hypothetical protein
MVAKGDKVNTIVHANLKEMALTATTTIHRM